MTASKTIAIRNTLFKATSRLLVLASKLQTTVDNVAHDRICGELDRALNAADDRCRATANAIAAARAAHREAEAAYAKVLDEVDYIVSQEGLDYA